MMEEDSIYFKTPQELAAMYADDAKDSLCIVGSILEEIMLRQKEDAIQKYVKLHGKPFVAKAAIQSALNAMRTTKDFGDMHPEKTWYDYDEEVMEPVAPTDSMVRIKIQKRTGKYASIDMEIIDNEIDRLSLHSLRKKPRRKGPSSRNSSHKGNDNASGASKLSIQNTSMVMFDIEKEPINKKYTIKQVRNNKH